MSRERAAVPRLASQVRLRPKSAGRSAAWVSPGRILSPRPVPCPSAARDTPAARHSQSPAGKTAMICGPSTSTRAKISSWRDPAVPDRLREEALSGHSPGRNRSSSGEEAALRLRNAMAEGAQASWSACRCVAASSLPAAIRGAGTETRVVYGNPDPKHISMPLAWRFHDHTDPLPTRGALDFCSPLDQPPRHTLRQGSAPQCVTRGSLSLSPSRFNSQASLC